MSGPELHAWMREHGVSLPVIYLSGHCDVPTSVQAMKRGAIDVLQKPAEAETLLQAIAAAIERHHQDRSRRAADDEITGRLATLSAREREVMDHAVSTSRSPQTSASPRRQ